MGANAQTTVPTFTASQVLTAAQMNQSARTGVPVFATTTDRDAAFGGAGEKTLAEGQLCYIEATDVVQFYNGSAWATLAPATPNVVQYKYAQTTTDFSTSSGAYVDWTNVSATITPTSSSNLIVVTVGNPRFQYNSGTAQPFYIRVLRGATAIGEESQGFVPTNNVAMHGLTGFTWVDNPATTSATTYKAQTYIAGGSSFTLTWGSITLMEVAP